MSYLERYRKAHARTVSFGLEVPSMTTSEGRYLDAIGMGLLQSELENIYPNLTVQDVVGRCVQVHRKYKKQIADVFESDIMLTIGHVAVQENSFFKRSEADYRANLEGDRLTDFNQLHCWLTLPTMEIIDLTFITSYAVLNDLSPEYQQGRPIIAHADELKNGMEYHPMLLGEDFFEKVKERHAVMFM